MDAVASPTDRIPALLRDPARVLVLLGGLLLVVGSLLDWMRGWLPYVEWFEVSGFQRAGDGIIALFVGIAAIVVARSERIAAGGNALLIGIPLGLGLLALAVVRLAHQDLGIYIASLTKYGGQGEFLPGFWVTVGGAVLAAIGGVVRAWAGRETLRRVRLRLPVSGTATAVGVLVGTVTGIAGGAGFAGWITAGTIAGISASVTMLFAIAFGFAGAALGAWFGGRIGRRLGGGASRA